MSKQVNIGIVGLGGHGHTLQKWIHRTQGLNVVSVFDISEEERALAVKKFNCYAASSFEDLLHNGSIDAVVIATPNHLHLDQVVASLNAGLHVLVEKPIANSVAHGMEMTELAEKKGLLLMVGHHMRFNRASRKTKSLLTSDGFGEVVSAELHFSANNTRFYSEDSWRLQPDYCPLLPVTQLGIHGIDLIHYFVGRVTDVFATARSVTVPSPVLDAVSALMGTDAGIPVTMTSNYCSPVLFECRIATNRRNIIYTPHSVRVSPENGMHGAQSDWSEYEYFDNEQDGYEVEIQLFYDALAATTIEVEASARSGLQALAVDEALRQSISQKRAVVVPDYRSEVKA